MSLSHRQDVFSYAWVSGDHWSHPQSWLHELGHNYYLKHASTPDCPYCDDTCAMGFCCTSRCFNAPHMWQVRQRRAACVSWLRCGRLCRWYPGGAEAGIPGQGRGSLAHAVDPQLTLFLGKHA